MSQHVAVIMGGWSAEREVSLVTGAACASALEGAGYRVSRVDASHDLASVLGAMKPDVVFNALHGRWGEDGCVQGILEVLQIPYSHSGVMASAIAMHKPTAKRVFEAVGIQCTSGRVMSREDVFAGALGEPPYVIKPLNEGSSIDVYVVRNGDNRPDFTAENWPFDNDVLVEKFVPGRELTVAVMGDRALGVIEIFPSQDSFYTYDAKYVEGGSRHDVPAKLPQALYDTLLDLSLRAHRAVGCRGVSRADFRYDDTKPSAEGLYMMEINTQPGMTPTSLVPELAQLVGMNFTQLVQWMVEDAGCSR